MSPEEMAMAMSQKGQLQQPVQMPQDQGGLWMRLMQWLKAARGDPSQQAGLEVDKAIHEQLPQILQIKTALEKRRREEQIMDEAYRNSR